MNKKYTSEERGILFVLLFLANVAVIIAGIYKNENGLYTASLMVIILICAVQIVTVIEKNK